jgi:hypothetical protein
MPTRKERDAQLALLEQAIKSLKKLGVDADGQVAVTRKMLRTIVKVAVIRGAGFVVMDEPGGSAVRRFLEGDPAGYIRPRLSKGSVMEMVGAGAGL